MSWSCLGWFRSASPSGLVFFVPPSRFHHTTDLICLATYQTRIRVQLSDLRDSHRFVSFFYCNSLPAFGSAERLITINLAISSCVQFPYSADELMMTGRHVVVGRDLSERN